MPTITVKHRGKFRDTTAYLRNASDINRYVDIEKLAERALDKLKDATPKDSSKTANSWSYEIEKKDGGYSILFLNSNVQNGVNIALLLDVGHATANGKWVQGKDYLSSAIKEAYEEILKEIREELNKL